MKSPMFVFRDPNAFSGSNRLRWPPKTVDERVALIATTDNQGNLSDIAVLLPFGIPQPWPTCGFRVGWERLICNSILHSYILPTYPSAGCVSGHTDSSCSCPHRVRKPKKSARLCSRVQARSKKLDTARRFHRVRRCE